MEDAQEALEDQELIHGAVAFALATASTENATRGFRVTADLDEEAGEEYRGVAGKVGRHPPGRGRACPLVRLKLAADDGAVQRVEFSRGGVGPGEARGERQIGRGGVRVRVALEGEVGRRMWWWSWRRGRWLRSRHQSWTPLAVNGRG